MNTLLLTVIISRRTLRAVAIAIFPLLLFLLLSALFPLPAIKPYSLVVQDRDGRFLHAFLSDDGMWRLRTSPGEIPQKLKTILLRREDRWFYYHPGVNPLSVVRALVQNVRSGRRISGASTITMQIARLLEPKERTYGNKLVEMFRALQLEWRYSKDELLELYLSLVPLGGNIEGLKTASLLYYQTPPERLNIAQLFDLILIPGSPNDLQPDRHPERLFQERIRQAAPWIRTGYLSAQDSAILWSTPAAAVRAPLPRYAPHFCLRVKQVAGRLPEVTSALDLRTQETVETLLTQHMRTWKLRGVRNGAVMVVDNKTREIVAYVGSEDFDDEHGDGQVDAVKALRSPGSTLKPFLYAYEMDNGVLTPKTRLLDVPYDAEGFLAENYDGTYMGLVCADEALRRSLNVPMVRLLKRAGVDAFVDYVANAGITSLQSQKPMLGLSLILGGCGVSLEELTGAYAALPARGVFRRPRFLRADSPGQQDGREFCSPATAFMITEILSGINRPDLPNNFESSVHLPAVAFKTGTSYGRRDAWSIGYSAEHTVGVWIGNANNRGNPDLVGSASAAPLLIDIFNTISQGHQKSILPRPDDLGVRPVCLQSGKPPNPRCSRTIEDFCSVTRTLTDECDVCSEYLVSNDGKLSYCLSCLASNDYRIITVEDHPAELLEFWRAVGLAPARAPAHNPLCNRLFAGDGPTIISPSDNMTYYLQSQEQRMVLQATSGLDVRNHSWYLNDRYLGKKQAGEKFFVRLSGGDHVVSCVDDRGRVSVVHIHVKLAV